ncbi:MAG: hypothetical protein VB957_16135 [Pseudomonadales bacterium]
MFQEYLPIYVPLFVAPFMNDQESNSTLLEIKRRARAMSKASTEKSYMQFLDQVASEQFGVRHYHEALVQARKQSSTPYSAMAFYLSTCQEYYLDF